MRLYVVAGEASGDRLVARLVTALGQRLDLVARGLVGPESRAAGVACAAPLESVQAFGLTEVLPRLPGLVRLGRELIRDARKFRPDVILTVDSPDLCLRLGRQLRGVAPRLHWVAPQVWAWRASRVRRLAECVDEVLCLLPFEASMLRVAGVRARFVGHPAALPQPAQREPDLVALAPGSRPSEIRRLWPVLRDVAAHIRQRDARARFVVPLAATATPPDDLDAARVDGVRGATSASVAITASGTATLEWAAAGVPQVVVYATSPLTFAVGRRLVRSPHIALPNVLAGRAVVPERVQHLDPRELAELACSLRGPRGSRQLVELEPGLRSLEPGLAISRVVDAVLGAR